LFLLLPCVYTAVTGELKPQKFYEFLAPVFSSWGPANERSPYTLSPLPWKSKVAGGIAVKGSK
jgi:hypothetical protein